MIKLAHKLSYRLAIHIFVFCPCGLIGEHSQRCISLLAPRWLKLFRKSYPKNTADVPQSQDCSTKSRTPKPLICKGFGVLQLQKKAGDLFPLNGRFLASWICGGCWYISIRDIVLLYQLFSFTGLLLVKSWSQVWGKRINFRVAMHRLFYRFLIVFNANYVCFIPQSTHMSRITKSFGFSILQRIADPAKGWNYADNHPGTGRA